MLCETEGGIVFLGHSYIGNSEMMATFKMRFLKVKGFKVSLFFDDSNRFCDYSSTFR